MGVRQTLNENPKVAAGVIAGALVIAAVIVVFAMWPSGGAAANLSGAKAYYSIDDGKTFFIDDAKKVPPFQKDGKTAYRAYVYQCPNGRQFVAYLARFTPPTKAKLEAIWAGPVEKQSPITINQIGSDGIEIKSPGQTTWMSGAAAGGQLLPPKCPNGAPAEKVAP